MYFSFLQFLSFHLRRFHTITNYAMQKAQQPKVVAAEKKEAKTSMKNSSEITINVMSKILVRYVVVVYEMPFSHLNFNERVTNKI